MMTLSPAVPAASVASIEPLFRMKKVAWVPIAKGKDRAKAAAMRVELKRVRGGGTWRERAAAWVRVWTMFPREG